MKQRAGIAYKPSHNQSQERKEERKKDIGSAGMRENYNNVLQMCYRYRLAEWCFPAARTPAALSLADIFGLGKACSTAPALIIPKGAGMYLRRVRIWRWIAKIKLRRGPKGNLDFKHGTR